jgi:hypothetical protein
LRSVLGARGKLWALDTSDKAVKRPIPRKSAQFATADFSTFPHCLWDPLWTLEGEDPAFFNLT